MRFSVEAWAPDYAAPVRTVADEDPVEVELGLERAVAEWGPIDPEADGSGPTSIAFVDGVQRVDARLWVAEGAGPPVQSLCASWAAGVVRCGDRAEVTVAEVERGLITAAPDAAAISTSHGDYPVCRANGDGGDELMQALQDRMRRLEAAVAGQADAEVVVLDGPLTNRRDLPRAIGYVKTHHAVYGPPVVADTAAALAPGQRTPLFVTAGRRHSWYLRLPGPDQLGWAGVVRCEAGDQFDRAEAVAFADRLSVLLPRFASSPHRERRAPQNLTPIAGLESILKRRLGSRDLLERALRRAAISEVWP